jgi:hypothetical protein
MDHSEHAHHEHQRAEPPRHDEALEHEAMDKAMHGRDVDHAPDDARSSHPSPSQVTNTTSKLCQLRREKRTQGTVSTARTPGMLWQCQQQEAQSTSSMGWPAATKGTPRT